MTHPSPSSALRELRAHLTQPKVALALLGIGVLLALAGPFGTAEAMPWMPRTAYWICVPVLTYAVGYLIDALLWPRLHPDMPRTPIVSRTKARLIVAVVTGLVIACTILALNLAVFGLRLSWPRFGILFGATLLISFLIELLPREDMAQKTPPPILGRLPLDKRGPLVALSVEDHYVRIRTTRGEEMVLLRLSDAIREVGDTPGLRVHRSHWVATAQVTSVTRKGDGAVLRMAQGGDIPVSRSHMPAMKEAGLLPR